MKKVEMLVRSFVFCFFVITSSATPILPEPRVINGGNATIGQFPWHVGVTAIYLDPPVLTVITCSGVIISQEWILTTARCIVGADNVGIHAGTISDFESDGVIQNAIESHLHEEYDNSTLQNDIALLRINPLTFNENISAVALPNEEVEVGASVTVTGWGHSNHDDGNNKTYNLQYGTVSIIDNSECQKIYGDSVQSNVICTGDGPDEGSACFGDEGAPLVLNADNDPVLVGLVSLINSSGCEGGYPVRNTRISFYRDWIKEKTNV